MTSLFDLSRPSLRCYHVKEKGKNNLPGEGYEEKGVSSDVTINILPHDRKRRGSTWHVDSNKLERNGKGVIDVEIEQAGKDERGFVEKIA